MIIGSVAQTAMMRARTVGSRGPAGFRVSVEGGGSAEAGAGVASVAMPSLLAMQEAESDALQDRDAKRHGTAVMDELTELQRALLGGEGRSLDRLASLAERSPSAADPRLAGVLRAVQLRARIELARHRNAASR